MQPQYVYNALITNVVDGDTVDAIICLGFNVTYTVRFRLKGINTPEMNDTNPTLREAAKAAKQRVTDLLLNKYVTLRSSKPDKYGRWLADIYVGDQTVSEILLKEGHALPYTG